MTPDPSGAARAPQTLAELLAEVKAALQQATPGPWSTAALPKHLDRSDAYLISNAPTWLGALVQAVEDQQRRAEHEYSNAVAMLRKYEEATREADALEAEVAQLRADGQRLRLPIELMDDYGWSYDGRTHFQINVGTIAGAKKLQAALEDAASDES